MRNFILKVHLFIVVSMLSGLVSRAQVVTVTNPTNTIPNLAASYTSLANAITALNAITSISGPVTITLNAGNPQTAPVGGYTIQFANPTVVTDIGRNVVIDGTNNLITANASLVSGSLTDALIKIIGADYITIQNFQLRENPANTNATAGTNNMTEWGIALLRSAATNGAQNNIIQGNGITLNKAYSNTFGIYSNVRHTATNPTTVSDITSIDGSNSRNKIRLNTITNTNVGICMVGSANTSLMDRENMIGILSGLGNSITNWGGLSRASNFVSTSGSSYGIYTNHQISDSIYNNFLTSSSIGGGTTVAVRGIFKDYATAQPDAFFANFSSNIRLNTISITDNFTSGDMDAIKVSGNGTPMPNGYSLNISTNTIRNCVVGGTGSSINFTGIYNTLAVANLTIQSNFIHSVTSTATTGGFFGIRANAAVFGSININSNALGSFTLNAITFSAATSGQIFGIQVNTNGNNAVPVSISGNGIARIAQDQTGTGAHTYIQLTQSPNAAISNNISNNQFIDITANTTSSVTFILKSGTIAANANYTETCTNNRITGFFSKTAAGGSVTLFDSGTGASGPGNSISHTSNNFSNITITGATVMRGWVNTEGISTSEGPTKNISTNTFNNWTCGTGTVTAININNAGGESQLINNTISNISASNVVGAPAIIGIFLGGTNRCSELNVTLNRINNITLTGTATGQVYGITGGSSFVPLTRVNQNVIHTISSSGANLVSAIRLTPSGTTGAYTINVKHNKIYGISATGNSLSSLVTGIDFFSSISTPTVDIANNIIGDLQCPLASGDNLVRGISMTSLPATANYLVYYNTVYLNASSTATNFGSSSLFLAASSSSVSGNADVRNNIFVNTSTPNGTGITAAIRRSTTTLNNFSTLSNQNIYFAGAPSANRTIYYNGSASFQTLAAYKTAVGPTRESGSFTEMPPFLSTVGSDATYLHLDPSVPTQAESGAVNITGVNNDYDFQIRQGNPGYTGTGTAPDIGADEMEGIFTELNPPNISLTPLGSPICNAGNQTISGVVITDDIFGVPLSGANRPRIYYRKNAGAWFSQPGTNTGGTGLNGTWDFTIVVADVGGLSGGDVLSYYIIAEDEAPIPNVRSNPSDGLVASSVNSVTTAPTTPLTYTLNYTLNGDYSVGIGGDFTTLTAAVNTYNNACAITGPVRFKLLDNTYPSETYPISINNHPDASASNTLTIYPASGTTPVISGTSANPIIRLNGARHIIIDGRQDASGTTRSLEILNNGNAHTIEFVNDAKSSVIRYTILRGSGTSTSRGVLAFTTAAVAGTGNDDHLVEFNEIRDGAFTPANAIYALGSAGQTNSGISILNNLIHDYFLPTGRSVGLNIAGNCTNWTISGNRFYQTAQRHKTISSDHYGIWVVKGDNYTISNNIIGFANAAGTGTTVLTGVGAGIPGFPSSFSPASSVAARFLAMSLDFDVLGLTSQVLNNEVSGIALYTASATVSAPGIFSGIYQEAGNANIQGNIIGSISGNSSIYVCASVNNAIVYGIRAASSVATTISNNVIGGITASGTDNLVSPAFTGISTGGSASFTIQNNQVGHTGADNIRVGLFSNAGNLSLNGASTATNGTTIINGILSSTTISSSLQINNNVLQGWLYTSATGSVFGIQTSGSMLTVGAGVEANQNSFGSTTNTWVHYPTGNTGNLIAIQFNNSGASSYKMNENNIRGIVQSASTENYVSLLTMAATPFSISSQVELSNNLFHNLNLQTKDLYLIYVSAISNTTTSLEIDSNRIVGSLQASTLSTARLECIAVNYLGTATGGNHVIRGNDFSNVIVGSGYPIVNAIQNVSSAPDLVNHPIKTVQGNVLSNWQFNDVANVVGILVQFCSGNNASITQNSISNFQNTATGIPFMYGIVASGFTNTEIDISKNIVSNLVAAGGDVDGLSLNTLQAVIQSKVDSNVVFNLSTSGIGEARGIYVSPINGGTIQLDFSRNILYDISSAGVGGRAYGIKVDPGGINLNFYNNLIADIKTPNAAIGPNVPYACGLYLDGNNSIFAYNNTIYLETSSSSGSLNSSAIYVVESCPNFRMNNNILVNKSTAGPAGRTVAYWRSGSNITNYTNGNNNNFYAGTPSASNLVFFNGGVSMQTLAAYQAFIGPVRDISSVSADPVFISTTGGSAGFLRLNPSANCSLIGKGLNVFFLQQDVDLDNRMIVNPAICDIGADEVGKLNIWTGSVSNLWNADGNWSAGIAANAPDARVLIPSGTPFAPRIQVGETFQVKDLYLQAGASLQNLGTIQAGSVIQVPGAGQVNHIESGIVQGSIELINACNEPWVIDGAAWVNNSVKNLLVGTNASIPVATASRVQVAGTLSFGGLTGKTLATNNNLVLLSSANATAGIADITGNIINGQVTVERFINTGTTGGAHPKTWQFLSAPTAGQSIFQSWQENGSAAPGFGTWITGTGTGFDATSSLPSLKKYNPASNLWNGETSTLNPVNNGNGYMLFVRGDRTVTTVSGSPVPTILRSKGTVYQPNNPPPDITVGAGQRASVGNPYPSAIDVEYMRDNGFFSNLNNDVVVWDPMLFGSYGYGGYQTLSSANDYEPTAGGSVYYPSGIPAPLIQSGQAFFVQSSGPAGAVEFAEACKANGSRLVHRGGNRHKMYFRATLQSPDRRIMDGNAVVYAQNYRDRIDEDDARKWWNDGENLSLRSGEHFLSVEARNSLHHNDTIYYELRNLRRQSYRFAFAPKQMSGTGLQAWLIDRFLRTETPVALTDSSFISFAVTQDPRSARPDRFFVVFRKKGKDPRADQMEFTKQEPLQKPTIISVYPNPVVDGKFVLQMGGFDAGRYEWKLVDQSGREIMQSSFDYVSGKTAVQLMLQSHIPAGTYELLLTGRQAVMGRVKLLVLK